MSVTYRSSGRRSAKSSVSAIALLVGLAAASGLATNPAWADGGNGLGTAPATDGGVGGVDGSLASATGKVGATGVAGSSSSGTGGGGGVDLTTGNGAPGGARGTYGTGVVLGTPGATGSAGLILTAPGSISNAVSGGAGGDGQSPVTNVNTFGGGGGGGVGVSTTAAITITGTGVVTGGMGGRLFGGGGGGGGVGVFSSANVTVDTGGRVTGGSGYTAISPGSGGGGGGAAAVVLTNGGTVQNSGTLLGGNGERNFFGGGGDGGAGVQMLAGGTAINMAGGTITGGAGGGGRFSTATGGVSPGSGGAGITGVGISVINAGTITGGAGGTGTGWTPVAGDAVHFTGGVNSLEIQSGSTITGNVVAFSTADTLKLGGATSDSFDVSQIGAGVQYQGFGVYEKTGASTWTLTGTTTAVTPWTISAGTLAISADDNLGAAGGGLTFDGGTLQNTAAFSTARTMVLNAGGGTLQADADFTASGMISGPGVLTKTGAGTLTLAADNTYTGGTTILAGTLQLGNGGAAGSVGSGNVINNGTLAFNRSDTALDVNGAISGTGNVEQIGSGTTVLTGDSTYTGGTTISAGTLQLGNGGTAGSISGDVTDNGTLAFDRSDTANFGGTITGAGAISQIGTGTTLLTGDSSVFAGATNVQSGILSVNGSLGGTMNVLSGGTLQGNGTVGTTTVMSGGTIAPGNSIGTLHVIGPYVQNSGSTYQVQLDPNSSASDLIAVNGTATLQPGSVLSATKGVPGNYSAGTIYHVLNASSGVTGTYMLAGGGAVSAFLSLVDTYDTNNAYLTVTQTGDPGDAAQTPNQTATAGGANGTSLENPLLNSPTDAAARDALDELSGELYASSAGRMLDDSRFVREAALDRTRAAFDCDAGALTAHADTDDSSGVNRCTPNAGRATVWTRGFGSWGGFDGDGNAASLDRDIGGLFVGADVPVAGNWRVGGLLGFSRSHFSADARNSSAMSDDYHVAAYGGTQRGALDVRLGAAYAWHDINGNRSVVLPGIADAAQADYRAHTTQVFGEVGYRLKPRGGVRLEPFAGLAYVNLDSNGFQEQGGASALRVSGADANVTYTTLGVHAATLFHSDAGAQVAAHGTLGWRHAFGNRVPETTLAFDGGSSFTIAGVPIARDTLVAEVGFDMALAKDTTLGVSYSGQIADDVQDHGVRVDLTWKF